LGKLSIDTYLLTTTIGRTVDRDNMLDYFDKVDALSLLWTPQTGRTMGQAAVAGIQAFASVLPTVLSVGSRR
jgi:hypothetical protein